ncbi:MAG: DUF692 domain-containing protein [Symploca sp. SIO2C1]|nr:DUF692 domain-containing protein [Symploca sp. SIO2C1]
MTSNCSAPRLGLPNLGLGVGLRHKHFRDILEQGSEVDWFEVISENFIDNYGYFRYVLEQIARKHPIVMHGVSLSIGSTDPLNFDYLARLKALADEIDPVWISDHLCWTGVATINSHDLLPLPLNEESFRHVAERVKIVQDYLERPLILENPSTYIEFCQSTFSEWEFLRALAEQTGCGLLLDLNNVYVSSCNHGYDAQEYIKGLPCDRIVQIHLAGPRDCGDYLIDTHDHPVPTEVWQLYAIAQKLTGGMATLLEWDANIPAYPDLLAELAKAREVLAGHLPEVAVSSAVEEFTLSNPLDYQLGENYEPTQLI